MYHLASHLMQTDGDMQHEQLRGRVMLFSDRVVLGSTRRVDKTSAYAAAYRNGARRRMLHSDKHVLIHNFSFRSFPRGT